MNTNFIGPRPWNLRTEGFFDGDPEVGDWFTFAHGGTEVEAEVVFHIGGYYKRGIASLEAVLRTEEGQYFLAREVYPDPVNNEHGYTPPPPAFELAQDSYWLRIKPLTLRGAMLRSFVDVSYDLKADLLAEMAPPVATRDAKSVTVPLTLPLDLYRRVLAMAAYDGDADSSETITDSMEGEVQAWLESDGLAKRKGQPQPASFLKKYERELDAGMHPDVYPPGFSRATPTHTGNLPEMSFVLDDLAGAMLRRVCQEGNHAHHPGEDPRDLVNAAVTFYLSDDRKDQHGVFDLSCGDQALERAKHDRLTKGADGAAAHSVPSDIGQSRDLVALLDRQASALVSRFLEATPWGYSAADIVNGAVCQALGQAFKSLDEELGGIAPAEEGFYDGGWGYVEEDIFRANQRREGSNLITFYKGLGPNPLEPRGATVRVENLGPDGTPADVHLSAETLAHLEGHARENGMDFETALNDVLHRALSSAEIRLGIATEAAADRPAVALAAAPEPELIAPDPDDDEDEDMPQPQSIREVLHELASDWLGKALEARQQERDFATTTTSGKFAAQADLLEGCAAALYDALDGKEGR